MKKFTILCSVLFGLAVTSLLAEETPATTTAPGSPQASTSGQGTASTGKKHSHRGHKKHHKKPQSDSPPATSASPKS